MLSINKSKNARPLTLSATYGYMVLYYLHWCRNTQYRYLCGSILLLQTSCCCWSLLVMGS